MAGFGFEVKCRPNHALILTWNKLNELKWTHKVHCEWEQIVCALIISVLDVFLVFFFFLFIARAFRNDIIFICPELQYMHGMLQCIKGRQPWKIKEKKRDRQIIKLLMQRLKRFGILSLDQVRGVAWLFHYKKQFTKHSTPVIEIFSKQHSNITIAKI